VFPFLFCRHFRKGVTFSSARCSEQSQQRLMSAVSPDNPAAWHPRMVCGAMGFKGHRLTSVSSKSVPDKTRWAVSAALACAGMEDIYKQLML
jgi:hypothetical protein